jgi:prepilin-type N-terminal cleavage/methylation domain-containing protein
MRRLLKQAFTLIELLVVIAIIGILSGLIIVGMNGMTNKATIAKGQVFSNSLRSALLLNLVSEWKLDQINVPIANRTPDSWNGSNTCTLADSGGACDATHCPKLNSAGCVYDNCLSFNGTGAYLSCGTGSTLNLTSSLTFEMWIYPYNATAGYTFLINKETPGYDFVLNPTGSLTFEIYHYFDTAWRTSSCTSNSVLSSNNFYHLSVTFEQNNFLKIYINGKLDRQCATSYNSPAGTNSNSLTIGYLGWWGGGNAYFNGLMDNIRIYSAAVPVSYIKEQYYAGANSLFVNGQIDAKEYSQRINSIAVK